MTRLKKSDKTKSGNVIVLKTGGLQLKRPSILSLIMGLIVFAVTAVHLPSAASSQTGDGWKQLFDGKNLGDWDQVGEANWRVEDGAIVADKLTSKGAAHLVSKTPYKDFMIYVEFWSSDDANSGIFLRCQNPKEITDRSLLRSQYLRPAQRPDLWHRRHCQFLRGEPDAEGRRQVEYL